MTINRATFFYEDNNKHGWTETLHSTKADLTLTMEAAKSLLPLRVRLNGSTAKLTFIRVSEDATKRDSLIYSVPIADQFNKIATEADIANTSLVVRLDASPVTRRTLYMRGIPDNIVEDSGKFVPTTAWQRDFVIWLEELKTNGWACKSRVGINVPVNISDVVQNLTTGRAGVTCAGPHGYIAGDEITITGVKGATQVNGTWRVFAVTGANIFTLVLTQIMAPYTGGGTTKKLGFALAPITKGQVMRVSHRIAGRPFDSPRGRRSKHKVR